MRRVRSLVAVLTALFRTDGDVLATLELLLETNRLLLSRLDRAPRLTNDECCRPAESA